MSAAKKNAAKLEVANFLHSQFGVQTMAQYGFFGGGGRPTESLKRLAPSRSKR